VWGVSNDGLEICGAVDPRATRLRFFNVDNSNLHGAKGFCVGLRVGPARVEYSKDEGVNAGCARVWCGVWEWLRMVVRVVSSARCGGVSDGEV
jgi:hypothetical protein